MKSEYPRALAQKFPSGLAMKRESRTGVSDAVKIHATTDLPPGRMPRAAAAALVVLGAAAAALYAGGPLAKPLGPAGINTNNRWTGRVSAIVSSPTDADRCFVAGADGGVWLTTDGGSSWTPLTDHMPTTAIGALALDPTDENVLYAGTGEANFANHSRPGVGLYKTSDGGDTWTLLAGATFAGRCFSNLVINPQNPQIMYASITRAGGFPEMAAAKGHPSAAGPLGVFRSTDGGQTWAPLTNGLPAWTATCVTIDPVTPTTLYAGIGHIFGDLLNGIYKSSDGGDSWTKLSSGMPSGTYGRVTVAMAPSLPSRLYAMITNPCDASGGGATMRAALKSDNGGASWTTLALGNIQSSYGWYLSVILVKPDDPNTVFFGGLDLYRSTTGGSGFVNVTPPHVDLHALAFDAAGRLLAGEDGGVHRSLNNGDNWSTRNSNLGLTQLYAGISTHPTDAHTLYAGAQDNGTNRRSADSLNWTQVLGGDGGWTQLDQVNPLRVFGEFQGTGNLYRSINGGAGFQTVAAGINFGDRNCFLPPYLISPDNSNRMLYGTHRVYLSTDGGTNWSPICGDLTGGTGAIRSLAVAPSNTQTVYAATNDGRVQVSFDGGATFQLRVSGNPGWPRVTREFFVDPRDDRTVYRALAAFAQSQIQRSRDAGQTWEALDATFPDVPVNALAADVRGALPTIFAGAEDGLYRSANDGQSWHRYGILMPRAAVTDLRLEPARRRLIVTTMGRGAWEIPISLAGDMNDDGSINPFDINPMITAITDPAAYAAQFPGVDAVLSGDLNGDGTVNPFDVQPFIELLMH